MDFLKKNVERAIFLGIIFLSLLCISKYLAFLAVVLGATWVFLRHQTKETVPVKINTSPELPEGWEKMTPAELKKVLVKNKGTKSELERIQEICTKTANKEGEIREQAKKLSGDLAAGLPYGFKVSLDDEEYEVVSFLPLIKKRFYRWSEPIGRLQPWDKKYDINKTIEFLKTIKTAVNRKLEQMEKSYAELDEKIKE